MNLPEVGNDAPLGDFALGFLFEHLAVRGCLVRLQHTWQEVQMRAQPDPLARETLGQALCGAALIGHGIKFRGRVGLQLQSSGRLKYVLAQCNRRGQLRGMTRLSEEASSSWLQKPVLGIHLDLRSDAAPYQGLVEWDEGGMAAALQGYFHNSEQLQTRFYLQAGAKSCTGLMLQRMPQTLARNPGQDAGPNGVQAADPIAEAQLPEPQAWAESFGFESRPVHAWLQDNFPDNDLRVFTPSRLEFGCTCDSGITDVIRGLGKDEVEAIFAEVGKLEVACEHCGASYRFEPEEAARLFAAAETDTDPDQCH